MSPGLLRPVRLVAEVRESVCVCVPVRVCVLGGLVIVFRDKKIWNRIKKYNTNNMIQWLKNVGMYLSIE